MAMSFRPCSFISFESSARRRRLKTKHLDGALLSACRYHAMTFTTVIVVRIPKSHFLVSGRLISL